MQDLATCYLSYFTFFHFPITHYSLASLTYLMISKHVSTSGPLCILFCNLKYFSLGMYKFFTLFRSYSNTALQKPILIFLYKVIRPQFYNLSSYSILLYNTDGKLMLSCIFICSCSSLRMRMVSSSKRRNLLILFPIAPILRGMLTYNMCPINICWIVNKCISDYNNILQLSAQFRAYLHLFFLHESWLNFYGN